MLCDKDLLRQIDHEVRRLGRGEVGYEQSSAVEKFYEWSCWRGRRGELAMEMIVMGRGGGRKKDLCRFGPKRPFPE